MQILNQLETEPIPIEEEEKRHGRRLLVGLLCALVLTGTVLGGYLYLRKRHERQMAAANAVENKKKAAKVEVFVDDATVNGKTTVLSGTLHNISNESLRNLAVELQLRRRSGSGIETRAVAIDTKELLPDGQGRYSLELPVQDYISATFFRVIGGDDHAAVAFKALPGAARPPLEAPASKSVIVKRPTPRGEEFINTPNTPGRIP
ncbi:MAG: hypothetical protein QOH71_4057 [Blastocatellia bacterium]|jgi:hypothetical protein|nr:hypothetical protein [Blastocatellia bacterium]